MSWKHYLLIFRLKSPLHVGWRKVGNLMQTRAYVPGKVLWGALTARLVRDYSGQNPRGEIYQQVGEKIKQNFRFGYLWPALSGTEDPKSLHDLKVYFPWNHQFDYLFLDCYVSTALNYGNLSAQEGSLHHVEFISPYTRSLPGQKSKPVYLVGDIFLNKNVENDNILKFWTEAIGNVQFGGERAYGWGKIELVACREDESILEKEGYSLSLDDLKIAATEKSRLLAHLKTPNTDYFQGQVEVLTAYHTHTSGEIRLIDHPPIVFAPGTIVKKDSELILSQEPGLLEQNKKGQTNCF